MTKEEILESDSSELHQLDSRVPESGSHHKIDIEKAEIDYTTVPEDLNVNNNDDSKTTTKKKRWGKKDKEKKEKAPEDPRVTYLQLYRFADTWDWTCVA